MEIRCRVEFIQPTPLYRYLSSRCNPNEDNHQYPLPTPLVADWQQYIGQPSEYPHEITNFDVEEYVEWRKTYWITGEGSKIDKITYPRDGHKITRPKRKSEKREPSYDSINKELTVIRKIYEFARLKKLIDGREIPIIKNLSKPKDYSNKKPGLSGIQYKKLIKITLTRSHNEKNPKHKRHLKLLLLYMVFMGFTGMRVAEGKRLKLSDCEMITNDDEEYLKVFVRAKGKSRELIGLKGSGRTLEELKKLHRKNASIHGWEYHDDLLVFANQYGKAVGSFAKGLNRAFDDAGLLYDENDIKRTAGAFRKYYITSATLKDINYLKIANSVELVWKLLKAITMTLKPPIRQKTIHLNMYSLNI